LASAAIVGLVGSTASSLAKVCLDSVIQHELPEASRASAFGLSETVLQLSWVFGGVVGLLIGGVWSFGHDSVYSIGFAVITVLLIIGLAQSWLVRSGRSLFPWLDYSRLSKHFRRRDKRDKSGGGKLGGFGRKSAARDAAAPPPAPTTPWQAPPTSAQAWSNQQPPAQYPRPTQYGPPAAYQQPPYHQQGPYPQPPYQQPYQQPYQPPAPYAQPYPPGYQQPAAPTTAQPSGPPAAQPDHPPARDAGAKRKWTKRS
jgi:FtsZ-interacting cell division protein ZipA